MRVKGIGMSITTSKKIEALRPAAMQSVPVRLDRMFNDPDIVIDLIKARAPYPTLAEYHQMQDSLGGAQTRPWFRTHFQDELLLQNPRWLQAAKDAFSAQIVRPFKCILNLNGPMPAGGVHVDLPVYRGFAAPAAPVWLLMNMTYSGLFQPWMVPIASGLAWFYRGVGGEFEYWADGTHAPPRIETTPMWNTGVMSDNEFMWHGVRAIGTPEDQKKLNGVLNVSDRLHYRGGEEWEIRDGARLVARLSPSQLRISLLWKAYVFLNDEHLASFENRDMDLTLDQVIDIYREDLASKGVTVRRPADAINDVPWRKVLEGNYRAAFGQQSAH
jgi:hypothetical protein